MNPGATNAPTASTIVSPSGASAVSISTTMPSRTRTSAARAGAPVPSTTVPPRSSRSPMRETLRRLRGGGERELGGAQTPAQIAREGAGERGRVDEEPVEVVGVDLPHRERRDRLD